jgi:hypothetical protein
VDLRLAERERQQHPRRIVLRGRQRGRHRRPVRRVPERTGRRSRGHTPGGSLRMGGAVSGGHEGDEAADQTAIC